MLRSLIRCGALVGIVLLGGCELEVVNPNDPETDRLLRTPLDAEALLGAQYRRWHQGVYDQGTVGAGYGILAVQSFENFSSLANNGMGAHVGIPRPAYDNQLGSAFAGEYEDNYYISSEVARTTSNILARFEEPTFTLGSSARDNRAKAFGAFIRGLSLGYVALMYDSGAVIRPDLPTDDPGELVSYQELMTVALASFQDAIDLASTPGTGGDGFPLPGDWIPSGTTFTSAEFIKLVRSYRARLRAMVARDPAERAAVDWAAVIADAQNGISEDHTILMNITTGPRYDGVDVLMGFGTWHQMSPFIIGMADVSGSYAAWIAQPLENRSAGGSTPLIVTPDLRFPQGATRAAQQDDLALPCPAPATGPAYQACKRYYRNRPTGNDLLVGPSWGWSNYDHVRFHRWDQSGDAGSGRNGLFPLFTKAEVDLLEAEGHIRQGNFAAAAALINKTRVGTGGLPAITAFDGTSPVPGGADCAPKTPVNARNSGGGTLVCANMFEALKYEKRVETQYTHYGAWFMDGRGWGDLVEGNGLHFAVPYRDLLARGRSLSELYNVGGLGLGNSGTAGPSTYGW